MEPPEEHDRQRMSGTPGSSRGLCCAPGRSGNSRRTAAHDDSWYILAPDLGIWGKISVFEVINGMEKKTRKFNTGLTYYIEKKIVKCMCSTRN